ncbi:hypothetical protein [Thalassotalea litorea]|uniref:hypothetical protein n=1 Tax=Thalassotalea litorea TaxID=2020715 RepID=UPI00373579AA
MIFSSQHKAKGIFILSLWITTYIFSFATRADTISLATLEAFSSHLHELSYQSPNYLQAFLSEDLIVEVNLGSSAQGVSMVYNKNEYLQLQEKITPNHKYKEYLKYLDVQIYNHIVTSPTSGQFNVVSYSRATRKKVWATYEVEQLDNKLKIVKIIEEM